MNGYHADPVRIQIREVWADNLEEEFESIRNAVERYQYVAMDTEFPGIVARPTGNCTEYNYQTVKCNVDLLKVIQLGITFADSHGNFARGTSTWQFNFSFDLERDIYAQDSIDFLKQSGIDFEQQQKKGISLQDFGELIMSSGLVMNEDVKWISFHGCYDFGYLLKLLTCAPLPISEAQFFELLHDFFPALYDIKFLLNNVPNVSINGGQSLQKIADHLNVKRIGQQHQAGSDSLVTSRTFFKLMETYFDNQIDDSKFSGVIYGLGSASVPKRNPSELLNYSTSPSPSDENGESMYTHTAEYYSSFSHVPNTSYLSNQTQRANTAANAIYKSYMGISPAASLPSSSPVASYLMQHTGSGGQQVNGNIGVSPLTQTPQSAQQQQQQTTLQTTQMYSPTGMGRMSSAGGNAGHRHMLHGNSGGAADYNEHPMQKQQQQLNAHLQDVHWKTLNADDCVNQNLLCGGSSGYTLGGPHASI